MYHLADLQLFVRIAATGSFSAAARQLAQTPAAASAAIKRLEQALEVRLFERSTRSLRLTAEGRVFRAHCEQALAMLAEGEAQVRVEKRGLAGEIHLAAPSDLARTVLNPWLDEFLRAHPGVGLVLHVADAVHDLLRDTVDLALRYGVANDARLVARTLHTCPQMAVAAPSYLQGRSLPATPQALAEHNCLRFFVGGQPQGHWTFLDAQGQSVTVRVAGDRCTDDSALARQWALEGAGILYKAELDLAQDLAAQRLQRLLPDFCGEPVVLSAVYLDGRQLPLRVRRLLDFLSAKFAALPQVRA